MQFEYEGYSVVVTACSAVDGTSVEVEHAVSFVRVEV